MERKNKKKATVCIVEWGHKLRVRLIPLVEVWQMDSFWWSGNHFKPAVCMQPASLSENGMLCLTIIHHQIGDFTARNYVASW